MGQKFNMETLYVFENGISREYTEAEYAQAAIDAQTILDKLPITIRNKRNALLVKCDWTQVADIPFSEEQKTAWATYRQALRDITKQSGFPTDVVFPEQPS
jgi:hypothetical protein